MAAGLYSHPTQLPTWKNNLAGNTARVVANAAARALNKLLKLR